MKQQNIYIVTVEYSEEYSYDYRNQYPELYYDNLEMADIKLVEQMSRICHPQMWEVDEQGCFSYTSVEGCSYMAYVRSVPLNKSKD